LDGWVGAKAEWALWVKLVDPGRPLTSFKSRVRSTIVDKRVLPEGARNVGREFWNVNPRGGLQILLRLRLQTATLAV
jgi:hypothetical protein